MSPRSLLAILLIFCAGTAIAAQTNDDERVQELYGKAKAAQSRGDIAAAVSGYEEILKISPTLGPAYNNLGALYFRQREYHKAAGVLEKGLKVNPGMPSASALLGISLFEMGEYAKARPRLETALKANATDNNAQMYLIKDLTQLGDYDAAATQLRQLSTREAKNQEVWFLLAKVYMKMSEDALSKMNAIDSKSALAHQLSGEMMEAMNNYDGAIVELKKAVELAPQKPGVHYKLGDAYWTQSQWDSAAEQFHAELAVDPSNCTAHWKLGNILLQQNGSAEDALTGINQALTLCPGLVDAHANRARALMKLNRNEDAVADLKAAATADPTEPSNHFLLAKAYRAMHRPADAQTESEIFRKLDEAARAATAERAQEVIKNKETEH